MKILHILSVVTPVAFELTVATCHMVAILLCRDFDHYQDII